MNKLRRFAGYVKAAVLSVESPKQAVVAVVIIVPWMVYTVGWLMFADDGD